MTQPRSSDTPELSRRSARAPHVRVAARTHVGLVRGTNEDAFVVSDLGGARAIDPAFGRIDLGGRGVLLAVSDGMGGAEGGAVASALVVETLARSLAEAPIDEAPERALHGAIERAHRAVWDESQRKGQRGHRRMGATLTAVLLRHDAAWFAEVGDSRAYLLREGRVLQLTHDQSMAQVLMDANLLAAEEVETSPLRNVILQAMGHQLEVQPAIGKVRIRERDALVLCSDGLSSVVSGEEIRDVVAGSLRLDVAAERLVRLANDRGGPDNVTVVVAGLAGGFPQARPGERVEDTVEVVLAWEPKLPR
jgi:serine/threonine protein phosphatase PrpC